MLATSNVPASVLILTIRKPAIKTILNYMTRKVELTISLSGPGV